MNDDLRELANLAQQVVNDQGIAAPEEETWQLLAELGWLMVPVSEAMGGLGMGWQGVCSLQLELGRGLAQVPYLSATLALEAVLRGDAPAGVDVEALMGGGQRLTCSLGAQELAATRHEQGFELSGTAVAVPSADMADYLLVWDDEQQCVALVARNSQGLALQQQETWDRTRRLFDVEFSAVRIDDSAVLCTGNDAADLAARLRAQRDFGLAAEAVGGARALLDLTVEYLGTRQQFGRPLAMFQALKHRCADLRAAVEAAEALLLDNLARAGDFCVAPDAAPLQAMGRSAMLLATETFAGVAEEALQLHGGIGMTEEHECHLYLKRAMLTEHLAGGGDAAALAVAQALMQK